MIPEGIVLTIVALAAISGLVFLLTPLAKRIGRGGHAVAEEELLDALAHLGDRVETLYSQLRAMGPSAGTPRPLEHSGGAAQHPLSRQATR